MGGLIHSNSGEGSSTIGSTAVRGVLTAGGVANSGTTQLVIYNNSNTTTVAGAAALATVAGSNLVTVTSTTNLFAGMTVSGTGIPAGTYITAVLSSTQFTTNFNATATAASQTLTVGADIVVNSVIADNGLGNHTALVKSGSASLILTAANTYSGGTTVDQGTLSLDGAGNGAYTIPAGGLTITNATVTMNVNGGQIAPTNNVTFNGSSTLTLLGNNTLGSITFNNNGGTTTPTVTPTGILTLTGSVTSSSNNVFTIATIGAGTLDLGGNNSFLMTVNPVDPFGTGANVAPLQSALTISSLIQDGGITKQGNGILLLSNAGNRYVGPTEVLAGELKMGAAGAIGYGSSLIVGVNGIVDLAGFAADRGLAGGRYSDHGRDYYQYRSRRDTDDWRGQYQHDLRGRSSPRPRRQISR